MEVSKLCSSGIQELRWRSNRYDRMLSISVLTTTSKVPRWRLLWRKLMREKKKNFDQGLIPADPDEFSRSFSARFAVPSRVFDKTGFIA
ncbi:hypothetical protein E1A91_A05G136300v1 [Gossypium mustelinum]|uniref:Uncharacterized protein n=1 Tax=Gossypium mustelinum TaxID=34275 RepID=A0A5D2Z7S0_GOSMU|nr:hypothetical protein E1A91_A05G136300v1 [Gossypium mustelinum]